MYIKKMRGFTLIEVITVISIIILLVGLLAPVLKKAREQAKEQKARAMISALEVAVNMFYTDSGEYPSTQSELINPPEEEKGYGPYMDDEEFDAGAGKFKDPWGNYYEYTPKTDGYIIKTTTPDGKAIKVEHP